MTEVAFHFNAPDKQAYACRLLRKAFLKGARLMVLADPADAVPLDTALWTFSPCDFIPHARVGDAPQVHAHSPIRILSELPAGLDGTSESVLVNLRGTVPVGFQRFARVIEVVAQAEADRLQARERWRHYRLEGIEPQRHDLDLSPRD
jgi:DNA polymerase-3 subunit chi